MSEEHRFTFCKEERLCSKIAIDCLFAGGSKSALAFPLRAVYRVEELPEDKKIPASILISVPKKRFHRAVKRNRVKRQVREAYRKNKYLLWDACIKHSKVISIAFIWLDDKLYDSAIVEAKMKNLIARISEKLNDGINGQK